MKKYILITSNTSHTVLPGAFEIQNTKFYIKLIYIIYILYMIR